MIKEKTQGFSLKDFSAAVIGVGGLGCNIAVHLAGAGIGRLLLFDSDKVSPSNLNRQFLYTQNDIGTEKVSAAKQRLKQYAPDTEIEAHLIKITKSNIPKMLKDCDIIFLAADNKEARIVISDFCAENGVPLMLGGIDGFYGNTYLYIPSYTPCPRCAGITEGKRADSNISATAGIIGSLQSALGIQYLLTKDKTAGGILTVYDSTSFSHLKIKKKNNCRFCKAIN